MCQGLDKDVDVTRLKNFWIVFVKYSEGPMSLALTETKLWRFYSGKFKDANVTANFHNSGMQTLITPN